MKENELQVIGAVDIIEGDKLRLVLSDGSSALLPLTSMPVATAHSNGFMSAENALRESNQFPLYFTSETSNNGFLCRTNLSKSFNSMFILRVTVNNYTAALVPSSIIVQGYMYTSGIMSVGSLISGTSAPFYLLEINDVLYFYFPHHLPFMTYYVEFLCNNSRGCIDDKILSEKPTNATREIAIK